MMTSQHVLHIMRSVAAGLALGVVALAATGCVVSERIDPSTDFRYYDQIPIQRQSVLGGWRYMSDHETTLRPYDGGDAVWLRPTDYEIDAAGPEPLGMYQFEDWE